MTQKKYSDHFTFHRADDAQENLSQADRPRGEDQILVRNNFGRQVHTLPELLKPHVIIELNESNYGRISKKMIELWEKGCSLHEISRVTEKSRARVRAALHRNGISTRPAIEGDRHMGWRKSGRSGGKHPPFGFTYYLSQLVMEPRENQILMLIESLLKEGRNPNAIAECLNKKGLRPRRAKKWSRNSVVLILKRLGESI